MRSINIKSLSEAVAIFKKIGVDPYGIEAMKNKATKLKYLSG